MKELFKNRNYLLLFQGSLVSLIGTTLYGFAAGIYILSLFPEDEYGKVGAFYFALVSSVPIILRLIVSPIAGALVDKWNKVRIIYMTDFISGTLFFLSLYVLVQYSLTNYQQVLLFIVIGGLAGVVSALFSPAVSAAIPEIVGEDMLQAANGASSIVQSVQGIVGVLAGVILYEILGIQIAILANAISFMLSGFSEMFIRVKHVKHKEHLEHDLFDNIKVGFRYIVERTGLLNMMKYSLLLNFAIAPIFSVGMPFLFKTELEKNGYHLAATSIIFSIAIMITGVYIGGKKINSVRKAIVSDLPKLWVSIAVLVLAIFAITYGVIGYWVFFTIYVVCIAVMTLFLNGVNIPLNTALVKGIEPSYRGRVLSILQAISMGATPIALILGGLVIQFSNVAFLSLVCTILFLYPMIGFTKNKSVLSFYDSLDQLEHDTMKLASNEL